MSERRTKSGEFERAPGRIYRTSEPEKITGSVRNPLTPIPTNSSSKVGWTVEEFHSGDAISRIDDQNEVVEVVIKGKNALKEGDRILAPTLVGDVMAVVARDGVGDLCWISGGFVGDLEYDDKRRSWVTSVAINKKLLI